MGGPGAGQHTKMVNQILIAANMIAVCEGLLYGYKSGLNLETVFKSVSVGAAGSKALEVLGPRIMARNFEPGFYVEHFIKDMGIALDESKRCVRVAGMRVCTRACSCVHVRSCTLI